MGWFLTSDKNAKKKKGGSRTAKRSAKKRQWDPARTLRRMKIAGGVAVIGALAAGFHFGETALRDHVAGQRISEPRVLLVDTPSWMSRRIARDVRSIVARRLSGDPFDGESLHHSASQLADSAWVRRVDRLVRRPDGVVEVHAEYRDPLALIRARDGYHLVDGRAVRLPLIYSSQTVERIDLPVIVNVDRAPPQAGHRWPGGDVRAGLALARLVASQLWRHQVLAVDVANHAGRVDKSRPHLALLTDQGRVLWGRAPGEERFYEPDARVKLGHIRRVRRNFNGRIDAGGKIVDVSGDDVVTFPGGSVRYTSSRSQP